MKKLIIPSLFALLGTGCFDDLKSKPAVSEATYQAATNSAYLQGRHDANTTQADMPERVGTLQRALAGTQNDIRILLTNQIQLNQRLMLVERLLTPAGAAGGVPEAAATETEQAE